MGARRVQGDFMLTQGYVVATGQQVDVMDMVSYTAGTVQRAADLLGSSATPGAWPSAIATPTAPTLVDGGTSLGAGAPYTNALTGFKISYNFPWGEGPLSAAATVTPTAHAGVYVTGLAPVSPALTTNLYIESAAGSGTYKLHSVHASDNAFTSTYGNGRVPPTATTSGATQIAQYNFAQAFLGVSNQRMAITGFFGTPTRPFGNSSENQIMVCRGGVFEFDSASATFVEGTYVGAAKAAGNALLNQTVIAVAAPALAIGKVFKGGTSITKVMVEIVSRYQGSLATPNQLEF